MDELLAYADTLDPASDDAALVRAYVILSDIADHAESAHDAPCVAAALGVWFAQWLMLANDREWFGAETLARIIDTTHGE